MNRRPTLPGGSRARLVLAPMLLGLLCALAQPPRAFADGMMLEPDAGGSVWNLRPERDQRAVIAFDGKEERLMLRAAAGAGSDGVVWVFPVPAAPDKVSVEILDGLPELDGDEVVSHAKGLAYLGADELRWLQLPLAPLDLPLTRAFFGAPLLDMFGMGSLVDDSAGDRVKGLADVVVHRHVEARGITAEVLTARTAGGLYDYLSRRGLKDRPAALRAFDRYIGREGSFVASWLAPSTAAVTGAVAATFPSDAPYFPLEPTSVYGDAVVPADIVVEGRWTPVLPAGLSPYARTERYRGDSDYTLVTLGAPSRLLRDDLRFAPGWPLRARYYATLLGVLRARSSRSLSLGQWLCLAFSVAGGLPLCWLFFGEPVGTWRAAAACVLVAANAAAVLGLGPGMWLGVSLLALAGGTLLAAIFLGQWRSLGGWARSGAFSLAALIPWSFSLYLAGTSSLGALLLVPCSLVAGLAGGCLAFREWRSPGGLRRAVLMGLSNCLTPLGLLYMVSVKGERRPRAVEAVAGGRLRRAMAAFLGLGGGLEPRNAVFLGAFALVFTLLAQAATLALAGPPMPAAGVGSPLQRLAQAMVFIWWAAWAHVYVGDSRGRRLAGRWAATLLAGAVAAAGILVIWRRFGMVFPNDGLSHAYPVEVALWKPLTSVPALELLAGVSLLVWPLAVFLWAIPVDEERLWLVLAALGLLAGTVMECVNVAAGALTVTGAEVAAWGCLLVLVGLGVRRGARVLATGRVPALRWGGGAAGGVALGTLLALSVKASVPGPAWPSGVLVSMLRDARSIVAEHLDIGDRAEAVLLDYVAGNALVEKGDEGTLALVGALQSAHEGERRRILGVLVREIRHGNVGAPLRAPLSRALVDALRSPDYDVRRLAAGGLTGLGPRADIAVLNEALKDDGVNGRLMDILGAAGPAAGASAPVLADIAAADKDPGKRVAALKCVWKVADATSAVTASLSALRDPDAAVRAAAIVSLSGGGAAVRVALPALAAASGGDPDAGNRAAAVGAQGSLVGAAPAVAAALCDPASKVRAEAVQAFARLQLPAEKEWETLLPAALRDKDAAVRSKAADALAGCCRARLLGLLAASRSRQERLLGIDSIVKFEPPEEAFRDLVAALKRERAGAVRSALRKAVPDVARTTEGELALRCAKMRLEVEHAGGRPDLKGRLDAMKRRADAVCEDTRSRTKTLNDDVDAALSAKPPRSRAGRESQREAPL